jgi:hypothetical protein
MKMKMEMISNYCNRQKDNPKELQKRYQKRKIQKIQEFKGFQEYSSFLSPLIIFS